jgi:DNA-binding CsgD family transcriptional regulator
VGPADTTSREMQRLGHDVDPAKSELVNTDPLLVVSILDGTIDHASVRRRLRAALSALELAEERGVLLVDAAGRSSSTSERRTLGEATEMPVRRLADRISGWHASALGTIVVGADGATLVVETTDDGSALLLREHSFEPDLLTARERDVMRGVEEGLSNIEIAHRLWIEPTTVRKHLEHIFAKLGVRNRTAALSKLHASRARTG